MKRQIPNLAVEKMTPLYLGGADGPVYRISDTLVAKFERAWDGWTSFFCDIDPIGKKAQNEYEVCKLLFEKGVSVPKPHGVFKLMQPSDKIWSVIGFPRKFPAFVMEYLDGRVPHPRYLQPEVQEKIEKLVAIEREKVNDLGFITSDAMGWENTIWVPSKEKIYLIDFSRWQLPGDRR